MLSKIKMIHIEPTNMCTLKCPKCARTEFIQKFPKNWSNVNINLEHLKSFLDIDLTNIKIRLCGNYGDPIYYPELYELIKFLKEKNASVLLITNGSYKSVEWWESIVNIMDSTDCINFSIDGTPDNFVQYRINADWESIKSAIDVIAKTPVELVWKYIPFSYNQFDIDYTRELSKDLGFDRFLIEPSDRWENENDSLKPINFETSRTNLDSWRYDNNRSTEVNPLCKKLNDQHYISADGFYMPCCFVGDYRFYYKSEFFKNKNIYDISKTTITELLSRDNVIKFYNDVEVNKLSYCTFNCSQGCDE